MCLLIRSTFRSQLLHDWEGILGDISFEAGSIDPTEGDDTDAEDK